ncbi:hypothetical protein SHJG_7842 [Streptomyces hygroscopicus subsp. jinggangensis 5008]|nr:hypothetical protein SHJG_7842 [Streptomyces hygroscopicus subsp. jinggangensis 5008]AGF67266.1 hypothetical protein SHJGH_7604 [Streptomyces hygroscopicus subsp. jinggangensis TL01]
MPVGLHVPEGQVEGSEQVGSQGLASRVDKGWISSQSLLSDYGQVRSSYAQLRPGKVPPPVRAAGRRRRLRSFQDGRRRFG